MSTSSTCPPSLVPPSPPRVTEGEGGVFLAPKADVASSLAYSMVPTTQASERNKGPILETLNKVIAEIGKGRKTTGDQEERGDNQQATETINVLEIASGTGNHAVYFATNLGIKVQPTDYDAKNVSDVDERVRQSVASSSSSSSTSTTTPVTTERAPLQIGAYIGSRGGVILPAKQVDTTTPPDKWNVGRYAVSWDGILLSCLNALSICRIYIMVCNLNMRLFVLTPHSLLPFSSLPFSKESFDIVLAINLCHIAPFPATEGLFAGASYYLKPDGRVVIYGPFNKDNRFTSPGNEAFHAQLTRQDPLFGLRDVSDMTKSASKYGLMMESLYHMPSNNMTLVFKRYTAKGRE